MIYRDGTLYVPAGTRVHERSPRRRDQPDAAEDAGRAAGGDGGAPGDRRRRAARRCRIRSSSSATQNPIEYEGTYPLPEAQLDRFLFKLAIGYPDEEVERSLLGLRHRGVAPATLDDVAAGGERRGAARGAARRRLDRRLATRWSPTWRRSCARRGRCRASSSAPARVPPCTCSRRRRARRGSTSAGSSRPTTSRRSRTTSSATGSILRPEAELERYTTDCGDRRRAADRPRSADEPDRARRGGARRGGAVGAPPAAGRSPCSRCSRSPRRSPSTPRGRRPPAVVREAPTTARPRRAGSL